jgi:hypothetical protein
VGAVAAEEAMTVELEGLDHAGLVVADRGLEVEITTYEPAPA